MLRLQVLEAKDLIKKDIGVFSKGSSDPYAIIKGDSHSCLQLLPISLFKLFLSM